MKKLKLKLKKVKEHMRKDIKQTKKALGR